MQTELRRAIKTSSLSQVNNHNYMAWCADESTSSSIISHTDKKEEWVTSNNCAVQKYVLYTRLTNNCFKLLSVNVWDGIERGRLESQAIEMKTKTND